VAESTTVVGSDAAPPAPRSLAGARARGLATHWALWALVVLGVGLRLRQYATGRSLWMDESFVALNVLGRGFDKLLTVPLDFNQAVPAGFLAVEKLNTEAFGKNEYVLRLFPLLCGLAALPLFVKVARRTLSGIALPFAVALFVVSGSLVYYSSEVKPYSLDVLAVVAIYAMSFAALDRRLSLGRAVLFGTLGALLIVASYAGIFAAAGCGAVVLTIFVLERRSDSLRAALPVAALWASGAIVFGVFYIYSFKSYTGLGDVGGSSTAPAAWRQAAHWASSGLRELATISGFYSTLHRPLIIVTFVAVVLASIGMAELLVRHRQEFAVLAAPVAVALITSAVGKFPLLARSLLFVAPLVFLFIGNGVSVVVRPLRRLAPLGAVALFAVLAVGVASIGAAVARPFASHSPFAIKTPISYIASHWRPGDVLYVHYASQYAFGYYERCDCFSPSGGARLDSLWPVRRLSVHDRGEQFPHAFASTSPRLIVGTPPWKTASNDYRSDVAQISAHKRAWVLVTWTFGAEERDFIRRKLLAPLAQRGAEKLAVSRQGAHLYLYDFGSS
jgi:hypothetical protein